MIAADGPRRSYTTARPWEARAGFARAVRIGPYAETSLCSPCDADGAVQFPGDVFRQTLFCIDLISESLEAVGLTLDDVMKTRYLSGRSAAVGGSGARSWHGVRAHPSGARFYLYERLFRGGDCGRGRSDRLSAGLIRRVGCDNESLPQLHEILDGGIQQGRAMAGHHQRRIPIPTMPVG